MNGEPPRGIGFAAESNIAKPLAGYPTVCAIRGLYAESRAGS